MKVFKIRASAASRIMAGEIGLTDSQQEKYNDLVSRKNGTHPKGLTLTLNMMQELNKLQHILDNPELPEGAKTYCKEWVKSEIYGRRPSLKNKYIDKGNETEEDGFTSMSLHLNLGMVYKNEEYKEDEYMCGTCDLDVPKLDTVFDNKSSWSLDTFPMFSDDKCSNDYLAQIQVYMHLWKRKKGAIVYTLNDIGEHQFSEMMKPWMSDEERQKLAINLIFTEKTFKKYKEKFFSSAKDVTFVEIPKENRVKAFYTTYNEDFINKLQHRVTMCREYIKTII